MLSLARAFSISALLLSSALPADTLKQYCFGRSDYQLNRDGIDWGPDGKCYEWYRGTIIKLATLYDCRCQRGSMFDWPPGKPYCSEVTPDGAEIQKLPADRCDGPREIVRKRC